MASFFGDHNRTQYKKIYKIYRVISHLIRSGGNERKMHDLL
jgi:hypothetical protein